MSAMADGAEAIARREADAVRRYVSDYYVRKDVLAEQQRRADDQFQTLRDDIADLKAETLARRATWKGAVVAIVVGILVGVLSPLLVFALTR